MKHEQQYTDDTVARQAAIAAEGIRRQTAIANAPAPTPPENVESVLARIKDSAAAAAQRVEDGMLNWSGGDHLVTPTPGAPPFPAAVVGVGTSVIPAPQARAGAMSFEEIMKRGGC